MQTDQITDNSEHERRTASWTDGWADGWTGSRNQPRVENEGVRVRTEDGEIEALWYDCVRIITPSVYPTEQMDHLSLVFGTKTCPSMNEKE